MSRPPSRPFRHSVRIADLRAVARLATQATREVASISEGLHQAIWRTLGMPSGETPMRTRGITGFVYRSIDRVTTAVGAGVDRVLAPLQPLLDDDDVIDGPARAAALAVVNGVIGDQLHRDSNPLATPMSLRSDGIALDAQTVSTLPNASGKVLLLIHGLCMNDLQWRSERDGRVIDHGQMLAQSFGYTPVALRYNSGRHISDNGGELAERLEHWFAAWPLPVTELCIVGHSMGGLVARSAVHQAQQQGLRWPSLLRDLVFLGTPHHGAPLERAGNWIDMLLAQTRYSAPFAKLGQMRSAGITDLRHGIVRASDWQGRDRFERGHDPRTPLPLPEGVRCHAIAAAKADERSAAADRLTGDGLVPLRSALGEHDDPEHDLGFTPESQHVAYRTGHIELLASRKVGEQLQRWLKR